MRSTPNQAKALVYLSILAVICVLLSMVPVPGAEAQQDRQAPEPTPQDSERSTDPSSIPRLDGDRPKPNPAPDAPPLPPAKPFVAETDIVKDVVDDVRLIANETGVPLDVLRSREAGAERFKDLARDLRSIHGSEIAQIVVPNIVTGGDGEVWFVGNPPASVLEQARAMTDAIRTGALFSEADQESMGATVAAALPPTLDWVAIAPAPEGVEVSVVGLDAVKRSELQALETNLLQTLERTVKDPTRSKSPFVTFTPATEANRIEPLNTTNGGGELWHSTILCTGGFTVGQQNGDQQSLATAAHCYPNGDYVWDFNPELNQWHLYQVFSDTLGAPFNQFGDLALMKPIDQATLNQWFGVNTYLQGDPEPFFYAWFNHGKRTVNSVGDRQIGEFVCYVGASNQARTCGHRIFAQNMIVQDTQGNVWGNLTYTTAGGNLMVGGSSGGAVSYNNEAIGIIQGRVITSQPLNGYAAGTEVNVYTPTDGISEWFGGSIQVCSIPNQRCLGPA